MIQSRVHTNLESVLRLAADKNTKRMTVRTSFFRFDGKPSDFPREQFKEAFLKYLSDLGYNVQRRAKTKHKKRGNYILGAHR